MSTNVWTVTIIWVLVYLFFNFFRYVLAFLEPSGYILGENIVCFSKIWYMMETVKRNKCFGTVWKQSAAPRWAGPCRGRNPGGLGFTCAGCHEAASSISWAGRLHLKVASHAAAVKDGRKPAKCHLPQHMSPSTAKTSPQAYCTAEWKVQGSECQLSVLTWLWFFLLCSYCNECMLDPDCGFCYTMNKSTVVDSSCVPVNRASTNEAAWGR